ncbi:hypothetical protein [Cellulomonas flavigena]|uniref:hypothetical protein n=1 Tax=Cellulomonas flavigena TaxID=1711 RepID=UPI00019E315D|nr:hypothetical protein [Cellulomonas flavigena]
MRSAVDNDVLIKLARYQLLSHLAFTKVAGEEPPLVLGAARFVARKRIERHAPPDVKDAALADLTAFLDGVALDEPSGAELSLALRLEDAAQATGLQLDAGESQLVAMQVLRGLDRLLTGDKRALGALEDLFGGHQELRALAGSAVCFEQVLALLIEHAGFDECRRRVCTDPTADRAASICLGFAGADRDESTARAALQSYIQHLRGRCPRILSPL